MLRSNWLCQDCADKGRITVAEEVHHIVALEHGGPDTDENARNLCKPCHLIRTSEQFGYRQPKAQIGQDGWPVA